MWLAGGKAALKRRIAQQVEVPVAHLPYNQPLVTWLREQRATGRRIVLCTASDQALADAIRGEGANPVPADEAIAVMEILEAGLRSSAERREIRP